MHHTSAHLSVYADLFTKNNITGMTLFLLTGDELLQIGVLSMGHRKELLVRVKERERVGMGRCKTSECLCFKGRSNKIEARQLSSQKLSTATQYSQ